MTNVVRSFNFLKCHQFNARAGQRSEKTNISKSETMSLLVNSHNKSISKTNDISYMFLCMAFVVLMVLAMLFIWVLYTKRQELICIKSWVELEIN